MLLTLLFLGSESDKQSRAAWAADAPAGRRNEPHWEGVYLATASPESLETFANVSSPILLFTGSHPGCKRCEFDGQISLLQWQGRVCIFGRANIGYKYGREDVHERRRHVQVISKPSWAKNWDSNSWSEFQLIRIKNVDEHNQIYFLHAEPWNTTHIIGTFLGTLRYSGSNETLIGLFVMWSENALDWTQPVIVKKQGAYRDGVHVPWHPVGLMGRRLVMMTKSENLTTRFQICEEFGEALQSNLSG